MIVWFGRLCSSADCRPGPGRGATNHRYTAAEQRVAPIIRGAIAKDAFEAAEITAFETLTAHRCGRCPADRGAVPLDRSHAVTGACKSESEQLLVSQTGWSRIESRAALTAQCSKCGVVVRRPTMPRACSAIAPQKRCGVVVVQTEIWFALVATLRDRVYATSLLVQSCRGCVRVCAPVGFPSIPSSTPLTHRWKWEWEWDLHAKAGSLKGLQASTTNWI